MDEIVRAALKKWPNVPDVFGWLALDLRGRFCLRSSAEPAPRFEAIGNPQLAAYIGRNYQPDERGRWFFQNGPQRVFVRLALTPWVFRLNGSDAPLTHTGLAAGRVDALAFDDQATPILQTDLGAGMVDDRDLGAILENMRDAHGTPVNDATLETWLAAPTGNPWHLAWQGKQLPVLTLARARLGRHFGFEPDPQPATAPVLPQGADVGPAPDNQVFSRPDCGSAK